MGVLKKKLILSLVAVLVLLVGAFTLVVKQSNQKGTQSDNNANSSYRVKAYQASQYRGVYQSKGFVEVANVDYNYLLVNDGDLVYKGTTKLTRNGVYAPMTGIFSKPTSGPARIYQQAGEVTFSVNENEYREFQVGDNLKITAMDNNSQAMAGKLIALAKVPADEHAALSKYQATVTLDSDNVPYFFGEHLLVTPEKDLVQVPKKYVSNQGEVKLKRDHKWVMQKLNPVKELKNSNLYSAQELPIGTELKQP